MRIPFLLLPLVLLLAACVGNPPPLIPIIQPPSTTSSTDSFNPLEIAQKKLEKANFAGQGESWEKKGKNGNIEVTLTSKGSSVDVVARFTRPDGEVLCEITSLVPGFVDGIENLDEVKTASDLVDKYSCTRA